MHPGRHAGDTRRDVCSPRACPAASGPWGRPQPNTHTQPRRDPSPPPRSSARGHPRQGRLRRRRGRPGEARSLTRASRAHEQAAARERDTRGQFTMPRKPLCRRETAGRTPLDTGPLLQGCTFTRLFSPVLVALRAQSRLRREGRARTLSGPSPELSPARALASSACMPTPPEAGNAVRPAGLPPAMRGAHLLPWQASREYPDARRSTVRRTGEITRIRYEYEEVSTL